MRSVCWGRAPFCWFKGGNKLVSSGRRDGGGRLGKQSEVEAGEKLGAARRPVSCLRLGNRFESRSTETHHRAEGQGGE